MGITLANFQLKAIEALMEAMGEPNRDIILKSCGNVKKCAVGKHPKTEKRGGACAFGAHIG